MSKVEKAYQKYLTKVEKNGVNDGISTSRDRFVILFNESQNKYLEFHLQNRGVDDIRYIEKFLILDKKIPNASETNNKYVFKLPENYLDLADVRAIASCENCSEVSLSLFEAQTENISELLEDEYNKPSFKWRESFYTVASNNINVYTDGVFKIPQILLSYYRYPNQISLINSFDPESKFNEGIEIEWDIKSLDRIISLTAGEFYLNLNNPAFQYQNARAQK